MKEDSKQMLQLGLPDFNFDACYSKNNFNTLKSHIRCLFQFNHCLVLDTVYCSS